MGYPAASRHRWTVAIEFLDGTRIEGTSDRDVIDRWGRLLAWLDPRAIDAKYLKRVTSERARAFYGARLIGIGERTPDALFLEALAAERCLALMRK